MRLLRPFPVFALLLLASVAVRSRAADAAPMEVKTDVKVDAKADDDKKDDKKDEEPVLSVTAHTITVDGQVIKYHATAGYMVIKQEEGKPLVRAGRGLDDAGAGKDDDKYKDGVKSVSKIFFTAYTLDDVADPAARPITFLFNGGPGSASIWLHMGSIAPRRVVLTEDGEAPPPPYKLMDNDSTLLDKTDLVFIDPVSTGYSRPMPKEDVKQFHGLKEDIASVGEFIRLYTTRNTRWLSPKFLMGESYGTTRSAGLSDYLQTRYGLYLNGIVLVSSCVDYKTLIFSPQNDTPYIAFLPTYATTAWYHKKLSPDMQAKTVQAVAEEARTFAQTEYTLVLGKGDRATEAEKAHAAAQLSHFTGFPAAKFRLLNLRMADQQFSKYLLLDQGRYLGRYDARFTGLSLTPGDPQNDQDFDPSDEAVTPTMNAAFNDYVRRELKYSSDLPYEASTDVSPWNFGDAELGYPNTGETLRTAMTRNPYLHVMVTCSYYDMATPFFGAEGAMASLLLDPSIRPNLKLVYYESGHMLYIHNPSRKKLKADFVTFMGEATSQPVVHAAAR
jgi:carboxypeptidase C (cathepsin A)